MGSYAFIVPSPRHSDLNRDPHVALHSYPTPNNEDAFYVVGEAVHKRNDAGVRAALLAERGWTDNPPPDWGDQQVFELLIDHCLYTKTTGHGDFNPVHTVWRHAKAQRSELAQSSSNHDRTSTRARLAAQRDRYTLAAVDHRLGFVGAVLAEGD